MGIEQFYQKNRGQQREEEALRCSAHLDPLPPTCFSPAAPKPLAREMGRGRSRDQRARQRKPLPLVPPPSWFLGEPAALRRLASHCGKTVLALGLSIYVSWNVRADDRTGSLASLSIEQLLNESVTSVSKKETKLSESPAAISVITQEDIRRSGMTSVPELLRMVPGLDVARINGNQWAISSRGFNNQYANKLLVLVDGRAVYSPVYGGVFWNAQDVVLEDVDRIEVIRGPGAALWGANAVNGVVNITTKSAKETQGGLVSVSAGTEDQPSTTVRYGGQPRRQCPRLYAPWGPLVGQHRRRRNQP